MKLVRTALLTALAMVIANVSVARGQHTSGYESPVLNPIAKVVPYRKLPTGMVIKNPPGPGPGTGAYSVWDFDVNTGMVGLSFYPPKRYHPNCPLPFGKPVQIRIYQSLDQGRTYSKLLKTISGGEGFVGMGEKDATQKKFIGIDVAVEIDHRSPQVIYLAAASVIDGREIGRSTSDLTFQYEPTLKRYKHPYDAPR